MQYGQRKLQRSITEMRRSRIGRASVSRGAGSAFRGTMTSRPDMERQVWAPGRANGYQPKEGAAAGCARAAPRPGNGLRPAIKPRHEALGVGIGPGRQLDEACGTG